MTHDVRARGEGNPGDEDFWEELLPNIERQRVVPIIGPDLLQVTVQGKEMLLDRYLASELADRFKLPLNEPMDYSLSSVVGRLLARPEKPVRRENIFPKVHKILTSIDFPPPPALEELAKITHFNLFVTTDIGSLLEKAINKVSFGGQDVTESIAYYYRRVKDLNYDYPGERSLQDWPTVYHLLGSCSECPEYVISEEDLLECVHALQADRSDRQPQKLFDALRNSYLLILGGSFPDWLARFFLRTARQNRLAEHRQGENGDLLEIVADSRSCQDEKLVQFLKHFSTSTLLYPGGGPVEFIQELVRRWQERNPDPPPRNRPPLPDHMPSGFVFISYASEDRAAVQELSDALQAEGIPVWFDRNRFEHEREASLGDHLVAGDDWKRKIETNIKRCCCFIAVLSQHSVQPGGPRYYLREWDLAQERRSTFPDRFIFPVIIDDTREFGDKPKQLPPLRKDQMTHLPNGQVTPEFVQVIRKTIAENSQGKK